MPRLHNTVTAIADEFRLPQPWSVTQFVATIGTAVGHPIQLLPSDALNNGVCGLWIATDQANYIAYEQDTSPAHQEHIILHELGHIIWRHPSGRLDGTWTPAAYDSWQEQQAEQFATAILLRAGRREATKPDPAVQRVIASLDPGDPVAAPHPHPGRLLRRLRLLWAGHPPS